MSYGLDKHIDEAIQRLTESLWLPYDTSYLGRSWVINRTNGNQPFSYQGNNEYQEVLETDLKDALIHFHVESDRPNTSYSTRTANVYIMVAVNLGKIYGSDTRAVEQAHYEVESVLNNTAFGKCDLVTDIEAYNIYDLTDRQTKLFNMQPYYVFRFESEINYLTNQTCPIQAVETYDVTTSVTPESSGTINTNPLSLTGLDRNTQVSINATPATDYAFQNWSINGVIYTNRLQTFFVTADVEAIATFINTLTVVQSVFESAPVLSGSDYVFEDSVGSNDVIVKNNYGSKYDGIGANVDTGVDLSGLSKCSILMRGYKSSNRLDGSAYDENPIYNIRPTINPGGDLFFVVSNGITSYIASSGSYSEYAYYLFVFDGTLTGNTNRAKIYEFTKEGSLSQLTIDIEIGTIPTTIASLPDFIIGKVNDAAYSSGQFFEYAIWEDALDGSIFDNLPAAYALESCKFATYFERGQGTEITNIAYDGSLANGVVQNADLNDFHSARSDGYSATYMLGCTLFQNNTDGTFMPVCYDANGNPTETTIAGFTNRGEYPAGSGILKGLPNLYNGITYAPLTGDVDYNDIKNETETANYQRTEPDNYSISKVEVLS